MKNYFLFSLFLIFVFSCSSKKNVLYLQDIEDSSYDNEYAYSDAVIKVDDILKIDISSPIPESVLQFNRSKAAVSSVEVEKLYGYTVSNEGAITFPVVGEIFLEGYTISEAKKLIYQELSERKLLNNHVVQIKILNSDVTILGEVKNPGKYTFLENNINILNSLGMAGDLNITADRKDIKIIRENGNKKLIGSIDLTNSSYLNSDFYQIKSGDIIIVNPNYTRVKNAGIIGNSGTLISLLSFILTSIILINN